MNDFLIELNELLDSADTTEFENQRKKKSSGQFRSSADIFINDKDALKTREGLNYAAKKGKQVNKWGRRAGNTVRDVSDVVKRKPRRKDRAGRQKKREWEKDYAKNIAGGLVATGGIIVGKKALDGTFDKPIKKVTGVDKAGQRMRIGIKQATRNVPDSVKTLRRHLLEDGDLQPGMIEFADSTAGTIYTKDGRPALRYSDARGKSARIHSGDSRKRNRRKKRWHEKVQNERKLWAGGSLAAVAATAAISPRVAARMARRKKKAPVVDKKKMTSKDANVLQKAISRHKTKLPDGMTQESYDEWIKKGLAN